jgi:hypothetical protein
MTARKLAHGFVACLLVAAGAAAARAQDAFCDFQCEHDMQWFAPVDFDYDCLPIRRDCGVFFNWEKVSWFVSNDRTAIGSPGALVPSEDIWPELLALDPGFGPPQPYLIQNGLQDVTPGKFGWGTRYEAGYFSGQNSYSIGIIDNQRVATGATTYGTGPQLSGFGSIHVNFELANATLLDGFRDYWGVFTDDWEVPTPIQGGPGTGGNGVVDDLNGNGAEGPVAIIGLDPDGEPIIIGIAIDYGDLYTFNVRFNQIAVKNYTQTDGVELMKTHRLDNSHWFVNEQAGEIEIGAGVRFMRIRDEFGFAGFSDLLRNGIDTVGTGISVVPGNRVDTHVDNQLVGPQLFARYTKRYNRFRVGAAGRFMFAYNIQDLEQNGVMALGNTPGDLNQPAILQPTWFNYGKREDDFSPVVEFRADLNIDVTTSLAFKLGYTAIFVDNLTRAASVTKWRLPDMGFNEGGQSNILINGADVGFELVF